MTSSRPVRPETHFFPARLMQRLESIQIHPLTLLEAPSGFGKTTALRHFFDTRISGCTQVFWHTFAPGAALASWKAFCALIDAFDPHSAQALARTGPPDEDTLPELKQIFCGICCPEETYLVLDDFSLWGLPNPGGFLEALSFHGGKGLHVVVASQVLPQDPQGAVPVPSSRFLLLQESVLAFSGGEIDAYYRQAGVALTAAQLDEVQRITEGWIMALYLQLLSFIEINRFEEGTMKSLIHKVLWNRLSERERQFLLSVSIFPRFSLAQATALSGMDPEQTEHLLREKRVFVHFDRTTRRFYLHTLFQRFLADRFALLGQERQREIYLSGGALAEQAGDRVNTLRFYYLSGRWERLLSLPLTSYEIADIADESTRPMILDIMENTPFETKRRYPAAMVPLALTLFFLHENKKLLSFQKEISAAIAESDLPRAQKDALQGEMELLMSFLEYNRIDAMSARHRRALGLLKGPAALINIKSTWTFGSPSVLYMFWRESGRLDEELSQMDECMPVYYELTGGHGSGAEIVMRAEIQLMRGEMESGEMLCHKAMFTADGGHQNSICQCALFLLARIAILQGDGPGLRRILQSMEERSRRHTEDLCRYTLDLARGYIDLLLGKSGELADWIAQGEIDDKRLVVMTQPLAHILYGRLLLARREYQKLLGAGEYGLGLSRIFPNLLPQIYIELYMAQALYALGRRTEALERLNGALAAALPDRVYLPFAENYAGIQPLLPLAAPNPQARRAIASLAAKLDSGLSALGHRAAPLSPRERQVLALLREGMTNPQIAGRLMVSVSTVKATVSSLLAKRGVSSRHMLK